MGNNFTGRDLPVFVILDSEDSFKSFLTPPPPGTLSSDSAARYQSPEELHKGLTLPMLYGICQVFTF